ncbi:MAG: hypothetical protein K2N72_04845 [Oscillospiraceae bacterium]|nr:hypothetical protein [Oscillospiraceae bacterium]
MTLYSKESVAATCKAMSRTGRFVHSFLITGAQGTGKKVAARYLAMSLLCSAKSSENEPCGVCRECSRILRGQHPDFIEVEKSGASFSVKDIREKVVADCYTPPNDCDRKVYLLADCDGWMDAAQDALLKVTEDPPDYGYFIFTAKIREVFLPTLISRSMTMEVHEAGIGECEAALREHSLISPKKKDFTEENISRAAKIFGGNIGCAIEYIEGRGQLAGSGKLAKAANTAMDAARAIAERNEYALAAALASASGNREEMRTVLEMLSRVIRDSAAARVFSGEGENGNAAGFIGCAREESLRIAEFAGSAKLNEMYEAIREASYLCTRNCSGAAVASVLTGKLL